MLAAVTAFTQPSRRTANNTGSATEEKQKKTTFTTREQDNSANKKTSTRNSATNAETSRRTTTVTRSSSGADNRQPASTTTTTSRRITSTTNTATRPVNQQGQATTTTTRRTAETTAARSGEPSVRSGQADQHRERVATGNNGSYAAKKGGTTYVTYYESPRLFRSERVIRYHYDHAPRSIHYRARHYPYRRPVNVNIIWTPAMHNEYIEIYPMVKTWRYPVGYRIATVSSYDAMYYRGEVADVYGKCEEVFYSRETDEFILYFGAYYPYHDFSIVVPGPVARRFSAFPERYFEQQYISVTGLITVFDGKPEIVVRRTTQLSVY